MPINLPNLDYLLETEYSSLGRKIKDYEAEYKRILEARKKEFKQAIFIDRILGEKNYSYSISNKLSTKQNYYIDKGDIGIRTEEFLLPVTHSTEIEKVEIYSSAKIPCGCWEGVRKKIAEENGLMIGDDKFYLNVDSIIGIMDKIIYVKDAKERLAAGIQKDFNNKLELTKI